jgi:hypothetical protein
VVAERTAGVRAPVSTPVGLGQATVYTLTALDLGFEFNNYGKRSASCVQLCSAVHSVSARTFLVKCCVAVTGPAIRECVETTAAQLVTYVLPRTYFCLQ